MEYSISQASEILNIPASTLRYYDSNGVIPSIRRNENGQRVFTESDLELIAAVLRGVRAGMKLSEFKAFYRMVMTENDYRKGRAFLQQKKKELEEQIGTIQAAVAYIDSLLPEYDRVIRESEAGPSEGEK